MASEGSFVRTTAIPSYDSTMNLKYAMSFRRTLKYLLVVSIQSNPTFKNQTAKYKVRFPRIQNLWILVCDFEI